MSQVVRITLKQKRYREDVGMNPSDVVGFIDHVERFAEEQFGVDSVVRMSSPKELAAVVFEIELPEEDR